MPTKSSKKSGSTAKSSKASASAGTINRKSLTVGVARKSTFDQITKELQKQFKEAGCTRCLSGLDRLIIDSRINVP